MVLANKLNIHNQLELNKAEEKISKQKAKKGGKDDKKGGKGKPDFLDLDKDGDKKETMKKAAKDAKEDDDKGTAKKGLTAGQKKLPEAMQKAILKKQK